MLMLKEKKEKPTKEKTLSCSPGLCHLVREEQNSIRKALDEALARIKKLEDIAYPKG